MHYIIINCYESMLSMLVRATFLGPEIEARIEQFSMVSEELCEFKMKASLENVWTTAKLPMFIVRLLNLDSLLNSPKTQFKFSGTTKLSIALMIIGHCLLMLTNHGARTQ